MSTFQPYYLLQDVPVGAISAWEPTVEFLHVFISSSKAAVITVVTAHVAVKVATNYELCTVSANAVSVDIIRTHEKAANPRNFTTAGIRLGSVIMTEPNNTATLRCLVEIHSSSG